MKSAEQEIDEFLSAYSEEIRELAQALRVFLKRKTRPSFELAGRSAQSFNIGFGFSTSAWDCFCAIIVYRRHINLSFPSGATLPDPDDLLQGNGKRVRHIRLRAVEQLEQPNVRALLRAARDQAVEMEDAVEADGAAVQTIIKRR